MDKNKINLTVKDNSKLRIHLDFGNNSLYDIGYLYRYLSSYCI